MPLLIAGEDDARARSRAERAARPRSGWRAGMTHRPGAALGRRAAARRGGAGAGGRPAACCWPTSRRATSTTRNSERLHELFARLSREFETALVVVTHNRALAARADRVLSLRGRTPGAALRRGVDAVMPCEPVPRARGGHPPHPDRQRAGDDGASLRALRRRERASRARAAWPRRRSAAFLAALGEELPSRRRRPAARRRPARAAAPRCRISGRPAGWAVPSATARSRRRCATCCDGCTARPITWASATPERVAAARPSAPDPAIELREQLRRRGRDGELRAGGRAARPPAR